MAWLMPHEMEEAVAKEVNPTTATPRFVMPHDVEAAEAKKPTREAQLLREESPLKRGVIGSGKVLSDIGLGAKQRVGQLGNFVGIKNELSDEVIRQLQEEKAMREAVERDPYASTGAALTKTGMGLIPGAKPMRAAAFGALEGAATPMEEPTPANVAQEAAKNAALYGVGTKLGNTLVTAAAKGKNAVRGRFADPEQERRFRIFKENEVPASLGDITQSPTVIGLENAAQHIPFTGRKDFLERQAQKLGEVIENAPAKISGGVPSATKEDIGQTLAKSIRDKYAQVKGQAKGLYDDVSARVQAVGAPPVPTTELAGATNKLLTRYPTAFAKLGDDPITVKTLEEIARGTHPSASVVLGPNGQPIMKAPQLSFDDLRALDSDLGALIRQGRTLSGRGEYNNKTFNQLVEVQNALRKDISNWSQAVGDPQISKGVAEANKFFKENVVPFRSNTLTRRVLQDENFNPDELARALFQLDAPTKATMAKSFLTPEGVQAGRYHLLKAAEKKAMDDALESGYSPSRFLKQSDMGETGPKLFSPDELGQIDDLQELIRSSRRAAGYAADPSTGNRLLSLSPFVSWKIPLAARAFSTATQSENPMRYWLADPRLYTGKGGLGQVSEDMLRRGVSSGIETSPEYRGVPEEEPTDVQ